MDRRRFLRETGTISLGAMGLPLLQSFPFAGAPMGIVVHSYASRWQSKENSRKYPGFTNAVELMEHCHRIGAGGIQVMVRGWTDDFAKKVRDRREKLGMYLEGSIAVPYKQEDVEKFEKEVIAAKEAGAGVLRTVTSVGRRYEAYHSQAEVLAFKKTAVAALQLSEPVLRKHRVKLAVENHKDWRADELADAIRHLNSEWIGVTLDFGNSISLIEDPMDVVEKLVPFVFSTHVKDMGVEEYADGFLLSEVPLGQGILDLPRIFSLCRQHNPEVHFSLEMITRDPLEIPCLRNEFWSVFDSVSGAELARQMRLVKKNRFPSALPRVSGLNAEERLAAEEKNILECMSYTRDKIGLK